MLSSSAKEVADKRIDETLGAGYGIFGGAPMAWATLKFTPERTRWVTKEVWHPQQEARTEPDGSLVLTFPYSDDKELVGDILRFGADVEVVGPAGLRSKVQRSLLNAVGRYL